MKVPLMPKGVEHSTLIRTIPALIRESTFDAERR